MINHWQSFAEERRASEKALGTRTYFKAWGTPGRKQMGPHPAVSPHGPMTSTRDIGQ